MQGANAPYPGAHTLCLDKKVVIWNCKPFDSTVRDIVGVIDTVFEDGELLVTCADGRVLITEYSSENSKLKIGDMLESMPIHDTMEKVISRHRQKYPRHPLAERILKYAKK